MRAKGLEFKSQNLCYKKVRHELIILVLGRQKEHTGLPASQPSLIAEFWAHERLSLKGERQVTEGDPQG